MQSFKIVPHILQFSCFSEFQKYFLLNEFDLLLTDKTIFEPFIKTECPSCDVLFQEDFGVGEPTDEKIDKILKVTTGKQYKRIIAVGGGTTIDIAKLLVDDSASTTAELFDTLHIFRKSRQLIIVPTTCGTGSEVTNISIVAFLSKQTKIGLVKNEMYADYAVLIPQLLQKLPYKVFITSSADALIHAVESFLSPKATNFTKIYSEEAIKLILKGFKAIAKDGEQERIKYIDEFLLAATYAGIAFGNAGCGLVHAMSYPISGVFHLSHGDANAQVFIPVMKFYNQNNNGTALEQLWIIIGKCLDVDKSRALEHLIKLFQALLSKHDFIALGMDNEKCKNFAKTVMETQTRLLNNAYVAVDADDLQQIYFNIITNDEVN